MNINKEDIEKILGCEIISYEIVPGEGESLVKINVVPKKSIEFIDIKFQVLPTGAKFEDF